MQDPLHLALLYGSTREGRFCDTVADWLRAQLALRRDYTVDAIDPALLDLPHRHGGAPSADLVNLQQRVWRADAFVVVVPEYNHGYPSALKFVIDSVQAHWQAKPVYFTEAWDRFDTGSRPREGDASERAARRMLDQLAWYGHALRQARAAWPYPAG